MYFNVLEIFNNFVSCIRFVPDRLTLAVFFQVRAFFFESVFPASTSQVFSKPLTRKTLPTDY